MPKQGIGKSINKDAPLLMFGFRFRKEPFVKSGDLKFGTVTISLKGGCHYG